MEGDTMMTALKSAFSKLGQEYFQNLDDTFSCVVFVLCAIVFWYFATWIINTIIKLLFPLMVCFIFLVILNEKHADALTTMMSIIRKVCIRMNETFGTFKAAVR
ncbi:uncharacterized protein LOC129750690 [Uranotaenia lowii]|uniref:uncharacterized protein LOC129750690 n=1 Tax=Uranotaenia lowii TaxID=190385 RepID=UPI00247A99C9|nr:uncharacterized protein LOC129750690 [Uranotaenia lowii]